MQNEASTCHPWNRRRANTHSFTQRIVPAFVRDQFWERIPTGLVVLCLAGVLIRLTVQDSRSGLALLYYTLPLLVITSLLLVTGSIWLWKKRFLSGVLCWVGGAACALWWSHSVCFYHPTAHDPSRLRVVVWNVAHGAGGPEAIGRQITELNADLIGLIEADWRFDPSTRAWEQRFPDYAVSTGPRGLVLLTRGSILKTDSAYLGKYGWCKQVTISLDGKQLDILLVDLKADPLTSRRGHFEELSAVIDPAPKRPVLVMGDFNTPADSVFFGSLRRHYHNAFESAGTGHHATWPIPLPVLALDQIWASSTIEISYCRLGWSWRSDHRPVIAELQVP